MQGDVGKKTDYPLEVYRYLGLEVYYYLFDDPYLWYLEVAVVQIEFGSAPSVIKNDTNSNRTPRLS